MRELIERGDRLVHLTTLDPDGTPFVTLAWAGIEDDRVVVGTLFDQRKLRNLRRDPRVVLSVEAGSRNAHGLDEYAVLYGTAEVTEGGAPELLQRLAHSHLGPGVTFPPMPDPPAGYVIRVAVDRVTGVGPWRDEV
ncbi:MAG: TIGR03618 family F420-dependent PPOX class oxidoreductase [Acidimicrobiia bacterium]|nr:TIGR03618 family F420-dependent PPOX class oxidoreductase [Acidimicrobiia bacterium]